MLITLIGMCMTCAYYLGRKYLEKIEKKREILLYFIIFIFSFVTFTNIELDSELSSNYGIKFIQMFFFFFFHLVIAAHVGVIEREMENKKLANFIILSVFAFLLFGNLIMMQLLSRF